MEEEVDEVKEELNELIDKRAHMITFSKIYGKEHINEIDKRIRELSIDLSKMQDGW
jgi:hypothetical protein